MSRRRNRSQRQYSEKADPNIQVVVARWVWVEWNQLLLGYQPSTLPMSYRPGLRHVFAACPCSRSTGLHRRITRFATSCQSLVKQGAPRLAVVTERESDSSSASIMPHIQYSIREVPA